MTAWRNGASDDPPAFGEALHGGTELFDRANGFVADGEAFCHRVLALQDVDVGTADRCGGDPDQRIQRAHLRDRLAFHYDPAGLDEDRGFHAEYVSFLWYSVL
jgi:hypothetical protein